MADYLILVTLTDYRTVHSPTNFITRPSTTLALASVSTETGTKQTSSVSSLPATTTPVGSTLAPSSGPQALHAHKSVTIAALVLAGILTLALVYLGVLAFLLWLHFKGRCANCERLRDEAKKVKAEDPICKHMVRARESRTAMRSHAPLDVEKGPVQPDSTDAGLKTDSLRKVCMDREATFANLEGRRLQAHPETGRRRTLWSFANSVQRKTEERAAARADTDQGSQDRYFKVEDPIATASRQSVTQFPGPAESEGPLYSYDYRSRDAEEADLGLHHPPCPTYPEHPQPHNHCQQQQTPYGAPMEQIDPTDALAQQYRQACYDAGREDNPDRETARRTMRDLREQMARRKRSRAFGGLPPLSSPRAFKDVDLGNSWTARAK